MKGEYWDSGEVLDAGCSVWGSYMEISKPPSTKISGNYFRQVSLFPATMCKNVKVNQCILSLSYAMLSQPSTPPSPRFFPDYPRL